MKNNKPFVLLLFVLFFCNFTSFVLSEIVEKLWTVLNGTSSADIGNGVLEDNAGNIYITGSTFGSLDGNTYMGDYDIFLSKYDSSGNKIWTKQSGTESKDEAFGITIDTFGYIYITGSTEGNLDGQTNSGGKDIFLIKYNSLGNKEWTVLLGTNNDDVGIGVNTDYSGNIYITGLTWGNFNGNINTGFSDIILAKYNSSGTKQWVKQLGTTNFDQGNGVALDNSGNVYITGSVGDALDGNTFIGMVDAFLTKYDSSGNKIWTKQFGTTEIDQASGIIVDTSGYIYITGETDGNLDGNTNSGASDIFLIKYDSLGNKVWTKLLGSTAGENGLGITTDKDDNIYITGYTMGNLDGNINAGSYDIFLVKYDSSGNKIWTKQFGSAAYEKGNGISTDNNGNIYITGDTEGNLDGNINSGQKDIFLMKWSIIPENYFFSINGYVKDSNSEGISNVMMSLTGTIEKSTYTTSEGFYQFFDLPADGNYTITPSKINYIFTPVNRSTSSLISNIDSWDFIGTYSSATYHIQGYIINFLDISGIGGVVITLTGSISNSTITSNDGFYQFFDLPAGGNYTIIPAKTNYTFNPVSRSTSSLSANIDNWDFFETYASTTVKPIISVTPTLLDFGEVKIGESKTLSFTIANTGTGILTGTITDDKDWVTVEPIEFSIDTGKIKTFNVTIDNKVLNQKEGQYSGTITINSNAGIITVTINLTATCVFVKPNPFNPEKEDLIFFGSGIVPKDTKVKIYTLNGELIKILVEKESKNEIIWNGRNEKGELVVNGIYLYIYESEKEKGVGKFTVIHP